MSTPKYRTHHYNPYAQEYLERPDDERRKVLEELRELLRTKTGFAKDAIKEGVKEMREQTGNMTHKKRLQEVLVLLFRRDEDSEGTGRTECMGVFERSEKTAHGAPVFVKKAGVNIYYLYRFIGGKWIVTADEENITTGHGRISSSKAADLPSEAGLTWDDPAVTCTAVRDTRHEHSHAYPLHPDLLAQTLPP